MGALGLSGLASGVDTGTLVDRLMQLERQSLSRITLNQSRVQARQAGLKDIAAKLAVLNTAAAELRAPALWANSQTVTTTDSTKVGVARNGEAVAGDYSITVQRLASSTEKVFNYTTPPNGLLDTNKKITINGVDVTLTKGMTATQAASAINTASNQDAAIGVTAAINGSGQLVLASKKTGAGAVSDFSVSSTQTSEDAAKYKPGVDAAYTVNGAARTSATNTITDGVPGMSLTLKAPTSTAITLTASTPAVDKAAAKTKLKAFVEAYNAVVTLTRSKTTEAVDAKATSTSAATKGQLRGDSQLTSMLNNLRRSVTDPVLGSDPALDELAEMGISTGKVTGQNPGPDSIQGKLIIDETKLDLMLAGDTDVLKRIVGAMPGVPGIAQRIEGIVDAQVGANKLIPGRLKSDDSELKRLGDTLTRANERLDSREKRLRAQFAAMESALQASQTQQAWLSGQLAQFNRS